MIMAMRVMASRPDDKTDDQHDRFAYDEVVLEQASNGRLQVDCLIVVVVTTSGIVPGTGNRWGRPARLSYQFCAPSGLWWESGNNELTVYMDGRWSA